MEDLFNNQYFIVSIAFFATISLNILLKTLFRIKHDKLNLKNYRLSQTNKSVEKIKTEETPIEMEI